MSFFAGTSCSSASPQEHAFVARQVVHEYVHDPDAFTQGLEYDTDCSSGACKEVYWESTGALLEPTLSISLHLRLRADRCVRPLLLVSVLSCAVTAHAPVNFPAGMYGQSSVREVDLATGAVLRQKANAHSDFAEGLVKVGARCGCLSSSRFWRGKHLCSWVDRPERCGRLLIKSCDNESLIRTTEYL